MRLLGNDEMKFNILLSYNFHLWRLLFSKSETVLLYTIVCTVFSRL